MEAIGMILTALFALFVGAMIGALPFYLWFLWECYKRLDDD